MAALKKIATRAAAALKIPWHIADAIGRLRG
jgi:hypothetical protein